MKISGYLDHVSRNTISGWARDEDDPTAPVSLLIIANGKLLARLVANQFRSDLVEVNNGDGNRSFQIHLNPPLSALSRHIVEARRELTGEQLYGSPYVLEPSSVFDAEMKSAIATVLATMDTEAELQDRLQFLAEQSETLLTVQQRRKSLSAEREARRKNRWRTAGEVSLDPASKRALFIDEAVPHDNRDAGAVAILSHMRAMQRLGYETYFTAPNHDHDVSSLTTAGVKCLLRPWYSSVEEALASHGDAFQVVYIHRVSNARDYLPLVRKHQPHAHIVFSVADLHSLRLSRQARVEERPELEEASRRYAALELAAARDADAVITHSSFEGELLREAMPGKAIHNVPFSPTSRSVKTAFAARSGLAFIGSYGHRPNIDAALWLVETVMPLVTKRDPTISCLLVGTRMPENLKRLASDVVVPIGAVEDLSSIFSRVRLTIAPLAFGAGIKGKVIESLAAGVPCVCTPIAAEGLDFSSAMDGLVGESPEELAEIVLRLHQDEAANTSISAASLLYVEEKFSNQAIDELLARAVKAENRV